MVWTFPEDSVVTTTAASTDHTDPYQQTEGGIWVDWTASSAATELQTYSTATASNWSASAWSNWTTDNTAGSIVEEIRTLGEVLASTRATWQVWSDGWIDRHQSLSPQYWMWPAPRAHRFEAGLSPEDRARREERRLARVRERKERQRKDEAAFRKAEVLLRSCLSPEQEASLDRDDCFEVRGGETGTVYRIHRGYGINIEVLGAGRTVVRKLCFHPRVRCPDADAMLCQKLMLELDESSALRIANSHSVRAVALQAPFESRLSPSRKETLIAEVIPISRAARAA